AFHDAKWQAFGARSDAPALRVLSYSAAKPSDFMALYKSSHFAQTAQFEFAAQLMEREKMGQGNTFDFLCIIPGSTALLGYETGCRSTLMDQMALHVDRQLDLLLTQLNRTPGDRNFALAVAGAHGVPPEPPGDLRERMAVSGESVAQAVDRRL